MSNERTILDYLEDISGAISDIRSFIQGMSADGFLADKKTVNAVIRSLEIIGEATGKIPKDVRMRYPPQDAPYDAFNKANLRLQQLREALDAVERDHGVPLELIDMGTEEGGAFPIHHRMYEVIASSDIIICDLTGQRPNVFVEAGYALKHHEKNRLIFLFEPVDDQDKVPFDLSTFKYVPITQAAEIPHKIKTEIIAILRDAGAPL
ncbi:MAG: DUF86 domain-containing protein [Desulfobacteraceae bacterium]|nr:DUF86 domain-containing protein [Desulfobacteraceae bacterium]